MSYFTGTPIAYIAEATCDEPYNGPYTYTWQFDDSTSLQGASVLKSWSTVGSHTTTVTCVNHSTGETVEKINIIYIISVTSWEVGVTQSQSSYATWLVE